MGVLLPDVWSLKAFNIQKKKAAASHVSKPKYASATRRLPCKRLNCRLGRRTSSRACRLVPTTDVGTGAECAWRDAHTKMKALRPRWLASLKKAQTQEEPQITMNIFFAIFALHALCSSLV